MQRIVIFFIIGISILYGQQVPKVNSGDQARQIFLQTLNAVHQEWFGPSYQQMTTANLKGSVSITLSGATVNQEVNTLSQGQVDAKSQGGTIALSLESLYRANGDYQTNLTGDFGSLQSVRFGNRGFIYSKDLSMYTTAIDRVASEDSPLTYFSWWRSVLNDLQTAYVNGKAFKGTLLGEESWGGKKLQRIRFESTTLKYDPKKREQSLIDTLGFWKRGILEILVDRDTKLPFRMEFQNMEQGVNTRITFSYGSNNKLQAASLQNNSVGFEGPGFIRLGYTSDGQINYISSELTSEGKKIAFDLSVTWSKDNLTSTLNLTPPISAKKKSREEFDTNVLLGVAGKIFELQKSGLNFRSVALGKTK